MDGAATEKARRTVLYARNDEHRKSAEPEVVHGSVPARWDTLEWLWSAPCESVQPVYRWSSASPEASVASETAAWRRCDPGSGRRLWPGCSGRAVVCHGARKHGNAIAEPGDVRRCPNSSSFCFNEAVRWQTVVMQGWRQTVPDWRPRESESPLFDWCPQLLHSSITVTVSSTKIIIVWSYSVLTRT